MVENFTFDLQMTHFLDNVILKYSQVKILQVAKQLSSYRFSYESVFSASKFTRTSCYSFLPRNWQSKVGSKWLKEDEVYYVSPRIVFAKKLNCPYGCKNQFCWLSQHLWKSNFQKHYKRTNPVVFHFELWSHMALFWNYA